MWTAIQNVLGTVSYVGAIVVASVMVGHRLSRRTGFWLRLVGGFCGIVVMCFSYKSLIFSLDIGFYRMLFLRNTNCVLAFILTMLLLQMCCRCTFWHTLFCVTAGYCMEHLSQKVVLILQLVYDSDDFWLELAFSVCVRALIYAVLFFLVIRKIDVARIGTDNKPQIVVALLTILFAVFINSFANVEAAKAGSTVLVLYLHLFSIVASIMGLFVEFYQLAYQTVKSERDIMKQLLYQEAAQYQREKETIDMINVKCHDLKHQLHVLEQQYGKDKMKDMRRAIDGYDSFFRTGCLALDTVLAMKNYNCESKHIQFTCMADGEKLNFLMEEDIYSLFGNILDNAIEAVELLPGEKRIISLTVEEKNNFIFIHCENYFAVQPEFMDGLPKTTKLDKAYHGFGSCSIQMIADRYDGGCTFKTDDGIFYTDVVLPIKGGRII